MKAPKKINFKSYRLNYFRPYLFGPSHRYDGCGATALGLLTGIDAKCIPRMKVWPDRYMVNFLKKEKWQVLKLTKENIAYRALLTDSITKEHLVLISMLFYKDVGSWCVLWNDDIYHNFEITTLKTYDFINLPILSMYLLCPPKGMGLTNT